MPTEGERREAFLASNGAGLGDAGWKKQIILSNVVGVRNYSTPEGAAIETAADFWAHGEHVLVLDVASELLSGYSLSEASKKNLLPSSGSVSQQSQPSNGTAETVVPAGSVAQGIATHPTATLTSPS
jgi:hypothetical protein